MSHANATARQLLGALRQAASALIGNRRLVNATVFAHRDQSIEEA